MNIGHLDQYDTLSPIFPTIRDTKAANILAFFFKETPPPDNFCRMRNFHTHKKNCYDAVKKPMRFSDRFIYMAKFMYLFFHGDLPVQRSERITTVSKVITR